MKFNITRLMASIFTPEFAFGNTAAIVSQFQNISDNLFDGEMFSFPMGQNAPPEIPRLILSSKNGTWKLEISVQRTNFIFLNPININIKPVTEPEFSQKAKDIFSRYKNETDIRMQRLAYVSERYTQFEESLPVEFLVNKYCKSEIADKIFKNNDGFEIHSLKKYDLEDFNVNSWVRLKTIHLADTKMSDALLLENDLNTFSITENPDKNFSVSEIESFFTISVGELQEIINRIFIGETLS
jgi:hypothetical protein